MIEDERYSMTPQQLSALYPLELREHDEAWAAAYEREAALLRAALGEGLARVSHIGSTAVKGLCAKPIVDILLEVAGGVDVDALARSMREAGCIINTPPQDIVMIGRGYGREGYVGQAVHIHVRRSGDWDELYFRDYLRAHPDAARSYGRLKRELALRHADDRDAYTQAKGAFIREATEKARREFGERYKP